MSNLAAANHCEHRASEIDEEIHLCPYNPHWADLFASEHNRLRTTLIPTPAIEHIGSTSVPGLLAKPVVDIMLGFSGEATLSQRQQLVSAGYQDMGEAGVPGRLYFRRRAEHSFNVHLVKLDGSLWKANLALRNYLRENSAARDDYAAAKRKAIDSGCTTLLRYSDFKSSIVQRLVTQALQNHAS